MIICHKLGKNLGTETYYYAVPRMTSVRCFEHQSSVFAHLSQSYSSIDIASFKFKTVDILSSLKIMFREAHGVFIIIVHQKA